MLNIITRNEISEQLIKEYSVRYDICLYNATSEIINAEEGLNYYSVTNSGHCACGFYRSRPSYGNMLVYLLEECLNYGEVILFFYLADVDYFLISNDVHSYIKYAEKKKIQFDNFLDTFMTKDFEGEGVVYIIEKNSS